MDLSTVFKYLFSSLNGYLFFLKVLEALDEVLYVIY